jgi:Phosphoenolpyruvate hydrolase-like
VPAEAANESLSNRHEAESCVKNTKIIWIYLTAVDLLLNLGKSPFTFSVILPHFEFPSLTVTTKPLRYDLAPTVSARTQEHRCFLLPAMAGFSPEIVDLLGCLPIADVNAQLVDCLATTAWQTPASEVEKSSNDLEIAPTVFACVFAADPFYDSAQLIDDVRAANISGIANLPSLGILEGRFAQVMSASGFDFQRELQCLEFAKRKGLRTAAFVWNEQQGNAGLQAHADQLVVHPGGFLRQPYGRGVAARATTELIRHLQQRTGGKTPVLLYRHPSLYDELAEAADCADGTVECAGKGVQEYDPDSLHEFGTTI